LLVRQTNQQELILHTKFTADQVFVRRINTALILNALRVSAPLSRAELAKHTGLNRSTVSSIITELIDEGFVRETELQKEKVGRPGMSLELNPQGGYAIGVEIGVDFISIILADFVAQVVWQSRVAVDPQIGQDAFIHWTEELIETAVDQAHSQRLRLLGIGVGVPGLVDIRQGELKFAPNLQWRDVPLHAMWTSRFNLPVFAENEANAAALGEYYFGVAHQVQDFIYLSAGVGLGGGIVLGGKLFRGSGGYAGEIGHMTIDPEGELCGCGKRGCWETLVGPRMIEHNVRTVLQEGADSQLLQMTEGCLEEITFERIVTAAEAGDIVAFGALQQVAEYLGIGIANLVNVFNPQLVVLGGALNLSSEIMIPVIRKVVRENTLQQPYNILEIKASRHGLDACALGAVALVLDDILREPML